ncbi:hypothetical protein [Nitratireductor aestuarii]|uniref:hypothetical protein n=1 Tax=Nitratireductor aestuarii TaxID=1735103 RepID=UPI0016670CA2|nr:hypothetical protein [Nitratireductor aestuarii]
MGSNPIARSKNGTTKKPRISVAFVFSGLAINKSPSCLAITAIATYIGFIELAERTLFPRFARFYDLPFQFRTTRRLARCRATNLYSN